MANLGVSLVLLLCQGALGGNKIYMMKAQKMDQLADESGYVYTKDYGSPSGYETGPAITVGIQSKLQGPSENYQANYFKMQPALQDSNSAHGSNYDEANFSKHGNSGETSYDQQEAFEKGSKGSYGNQHHEGFNSNRGNSIKALEDEAKHYGTHHQKGGNYEGGSFGHATYRKKGSETSGYHKVYHKDELKKKHTFYDDADHKGSFKKYNQADASHQSNAGNIEKAANSDAGHHKKDFSKSGGFDNGNYDVADKAYRSKEGQEEYFENQSESGKNGRASYSYKQLH